MLISAEYLESSTPGGFNASILGMSITQKMSDCGSQQFGFHCKDGWIQHSQAEIPIMFKYSFLYAWPSGETLCF